MLSKSTKLMSLTLLSICISACGGGSSEESKTPTKPIFTVGNLSLNDYEDTGASSDDFISQDNNFSLALMGQTQGAVITYQVSKDDGKTWSETTVKQENLVDGRYQFKAIAKDSTGQELSSNIIKITVDRTAPIIQSANIQNIDENTDGASDYSLIKGKTEANLLMTIKTENKDIGGAPVYADSNGNFSLEIPVRTSGETFAIQAQDIAGNISTTSTVQAPTEKGQYDDIPVTEITGVYKLRYNFKQNEFLEQFVIINDQGLMTVLNDKNSGFYSKTLNNPQACYGLPEVGTPNWKLQGRKIYKKQPEDKTYYINVNGVEYKFDQNLDYLHNDGVLARYSSFVPADINYGSMDWLLFPFAKNDMVQQSLLNQVCSQDKNNLTKPVYPQLIDARAVSGILNSSKDNKQSYTAISEHGKINVYQYDDARKCYIRPSTMQTNFDFNQKYISKDTQGFYVNQPYATTGFGTMAWAKFTLQPLNNKTGLKVEGNYGQIFLPDTTGRMTEQNTSPNIYKPEFRDWVLGGNYETKVTQAQLEQQLCK